MENVYKRFWKTWAILLALTTVMVFVDVMDMPRTLMLAGGQGSRRTTRVVTVIPAPAPSCAAILATPGFTAMTVAVLAPVEASATTLLPGPAEPNRLEGGAAEAGTSLTTLH